MAAAGCTDKRIALALDPTAIGNRFTVLAVSILFRGGAVPVAWNVRVGDAKGSWNDQWRILLERLRDELGDGWQVLVLTDRGLESKELFEIIVGLGWHPVMRAKKRGGFRPHGWYHSRPMGQFVWEIGGRWVGRGIAWPKTSRLECTLLACWEEGHEEPWLILTAVTAGSINALWYRWRSWIEQGFRDLKSDGWDLAKTRMSDPERVARWWTAAALAMLRVMEAGAEATRLEIPATRTHAGQNKPSPTSVFRLGLTWLSSLLQRGGRQDIPPLPRQPWPHDPAFDLPEQQPSPPPG